jgi:membrane protease YdiL (CAAX protease family)
VAHVIPIVFFSMWMAVSGSENVQTDDQFLLLVLCGRLLALGVTVFALTRYVGGNWWSIINLGRPRVVHCVLALLCLPAMIPPTAILLSMVASGVSIDGADMPPIPYAGSALWLVLLVSAVAPAVGEELFFRGFVGSRLLGRYGVTLGILFTTALFAIVHVNVAQVALAFVAGLFLHAFYLASRSIWVPVLLHFLANASVMVVNRYLAVTPSFEPTDEQLIYLLISFVTLLLATVLACWGMYCLRVKTEPEPQALTAG